MDTAAAPSTARTVTGEELARMPGLGPCELVEGEDVLQGFMLPLNELFTG